MIFNEMNNNVATEEVVAESAYDLGIGGALMHVWENECNYNALMKAAALSEMKYYNENGGDLFVQEAGAFSGLVQKVKAFFLKVIEKIKSIAAKFMAQINKYVMDDKKFVDKYGKTLIARKSELKDFEFDGYKFTSTLENVKVDFVAGDNRTKGITGDSDQDAINTRVEKNRGYLVTGSSEEGLTESEYREKLREKFYGDKEKFSVDIVQQLGIIKNAKDLTTKANKKKDDLIKAINTMIKDLEKKSNTAFKSIDVEDKNGENDKNAKDISEFNNHIKIFKDFYNDATVYFGAYVKAIADSNRQAKAICVKALSYKHEAATVAEGGYSNIFAGVEIV